MLEDEAESMLADDDDDLADSLAIEEDIADEAPEMTGRACPSSAPVPQAISWPSG